MRSETSKKNLVNRSACSRYIKQQAPHIKSISSDFWPLLERRLASVLDSAIKNNGHHRRLTAAELQSAGPGLWSRLFKAVKGE
jgi:hypothetical protein